MQQQDPSAVISQAALADTSALCRQALDLFVALYGAEAGNMALKIMATAGVYIGGGIAPKIIRLDLHGCVRGQGAPQAIATADSGTYYHE